MRHLNDKNVKNVEVSFNDILHSIKKVMLILHRVRKINDTTLRYNDIVTIKDLKAVSVKHEFG